VPKHHVLKVQKQRAKLSNTKVSDQLYASAALGLLYPLDKRLGEFQSHPQLGGKQKNLYTYWEFSWFSYHMVDQWFPKWAVPLHGGQWDYLGGAGGGSLRARCSLIYN
jgi:hypothetical protein